MAGLLKEVVMRYHARGFLLFSFALLCLTGFAPKSVWADPASGWQPTGSGYDALIVDDSPHILPGQSARLLLQLVPSNWDSKPCTIDVASVPMGVLAAPTSITFTPPEAGIIALTIAIPSDAKPGGPKVLTIHLAANSKPLTVSIPYYVAAESVSRPPTHEINKSAPSTDDDSSTSTSSTSVGDNETQQSCNHGGGFLQALINLIFHSHSSDSGDDNSGNSKSSKPSRPTSPQAPQDPNNNNDKGLSQR